MPRALITGITGQDGSYLAELLLDKGYEVHGTVRSQSSLESSRLGPLLKRPGLLNAGLFLHPFDLRHPGPLREILLRRPMDEFYHLAGPSHVGRSFQEAEPTCELIAMGTLRLLELIRELRQPLRFFYASSSEVFGCPDSMPQDEQTPFRPASPYGAARAFATHLVSIYRQAFGVFASTGILYNHESPRRGSSFVTQKICQAAAAIKSGRQSELRLGILTPQRDWGDARDYVRGMWQALRHPTPQDFVFATGTLHSVQEVLEIAFGAVDLDWRKYVKEDPQLLRPDEPSRLAGNAEKARRLLGWTPETSFKELITEMVQSALNQEPARNLST